jgi:hypothetical protein
MAGMRRLDRDMTLVATGLLIAVISAAIALALLERDPKGDQFSKESWQTQANFR